MNEKEPVLWEVCMALFLRRAEKRIGEPCPGQELIRVAHRLFDAEDFEILSKAKNALDDGYFDFLVHLRLVRIFLRQEAKEARHVEDATEKDIRGMNRAEKRRFIGRWWKSEDGAEFKKKLQKIVDESQKSSAGALRTRAQTDLPTRGMIRAVHEAVFTNERKFWKHHPADMSAIWRDAGLDEIPQDRTGGKVTCSQKTGAKRM